MAETAASNAPPLLVGLPEALGRRMRLGPFPSSRHALKFAAYAAIGGAVAAVLGVVWSVPFLGAGFLLSVYQPDGRALDEQFGEYVHYRWRTGPGTARSGSPRRDPGADGPYLTSVPGQLVAILSVRGLPIAFLPPADARSLFEAYRELLRSLGRGLVVHMGVEPLTERPFLPPGRPTEAGGAEEAGRRGYSEMVRVLCRRRYRRRVLIALWEPTGPDAAIRLERELERLGGSLGRLGVETVRLRAAPLRSAAAQIGWREARNP
jgi:hypothetical protein